MRWFSADHHFWHGGAIELCGRPFLSVWDMSASMVRRWNMRVQPDDEVLYLGDFSFGNAALTKSIIEQLNGQKVLIRGNHDKGRTETWWKRAGFIDVMDSHAIWMDGQRVMLSHFPYRLHEIDQRRFKESLWDMGDWLLHGHVHEGWSQNGRMINVGVDVRDFRPVSEREVLEIMTAKPLGNVSGTLAERLPNVR